MAVPNHVQNLFPRVRTVTEHLRRELLDKTQQLSHLQQAIVRTAEEHVSSGPGQGFSPGLGLGYACWGGGQGRQAQGSRVPVTWAAWAAWAATCTCACRRQI
jgi:hypothetical protein